MSKEKDELQAFFKENVITKLSVEAEKTRKVKERKAEYEAHKAEIKDMLETIEDFMPPIAKLEWFDGHRDRFVSSKCQVSFKGPRFQDGVGYAFTVEIVRIKEATKYYATCGSGYCDTIFEVAKAIIAECVQRYDVTLKA
jgi:uncharacterized protein YecA (UPF0149 family)